jgi:hypothetical protein
VTKWNVGPPSIRTGSEHLLLELRKPVDPTVEPALDLELVGRLGGCRVEPLLELDLVDLALGEVLLDLPLDHLVDDDPEGHAVAAVALELGEEADRDLGRGGDRVVLVSHLDPAAVEYHAVVALDEGGVLAELGLPLIVSISRIVHRCSSQLGHGRILRAPWA